MPTATVRWVKDLQFVGTDSGGHSVVLSGDKTAQGVRPSEMLLVALAACSSVDVVEIMAKKRQPLTGLEVVITGEHAPDPPWAYQTIRILYKLRGQGLTEKAVAQAVQLSTDKYCSVAATVRGVARISTAYEWVDESV